MNIILYRYSPWISKLNFLNYDNSILFVPIKQKDAYEKYAIQFEQFPRIEYFKEFTLKEFVKVIDYLIKEEALVINSITTQCEEDIIDAGLLNDFYKSEYSEGFINTCFRDKYVMRSFLQGVIEQPDFQLISSPSDIEDFKKRNSNNDYVIKHRLGFGTKSVRKISSSTVIDTVDYVDGIYSGNYLIENYVPDTMMVSNDGYAIGSEIKHFFVHDYDQSVLTVVESTHEHIVRTSHLYKKNINLIEKMKETSQKILKRFNALSAINPFHIEWFINPKQGQLILCEIARRYGGASIPSLVLNSFHVDLLKEYWENISLDKVVDTPMELELPSIISVSYQRTAEEGILKSLPEDALFEWTNFYYNFFQKNQKITYKKEEQIPVYFIAEFSCQDDNDYQHKKQKMKLLSDMFIVEKSKVYFE
ncbi:hypothetical protein [Enterococcus caccae]|uniref:ATP-grasp domain-containing protein n=1 Tax=Enterococcus caccae ATCC BAA-1240 TaxID=1158612 RepID=R3W831_9ENTE|nr:hypothetical protein [Enterococcus caccae]EOL43662.1 hypothetical protein UC7_02992 [Enterococcus caccae ATCC BAA-1240]EOT67938.1 hypothetical protein I580_00320 [Enterococcus caccae ATCC BAA-1240]OJG28574.1 hypothetical protein RU98_GL000167 [Enterococcus caccae]